jgi:hypothetical protein
LGDVAVPADGPRRGEDFGKLLEPKLVPLDRLVIRSYQGWRMIEAMEWSKALVAIYTALPFIPLGNYIPHEAVLRISFDLLQALLTAALMFRPA